LDLLSGNITNLVFRRTLKREKGDVTLDHRTLTVFMELDGRADLGRVAGRSGLKMSAVREIVARLLQMDLIEPVSRQGAFIDQEFVDFLKSQLALSVGPIAGLLIADEIEHMGYTPSAFPCREASNLVNRLAMEIRREDRKRDFLKSMKRKIDTRGYHR
jgi:hypothetical protein